MSDKLHVRGFILVLAPALMEVGWSHQRFKEWIAATRARMGDGGETKQWVMAMAESLAGDERAEAAFMRAFAEWTR